MDLKLQPDAPTILRRSGDQRTLLEIREAYLLERRLSDQLRTAAEHDRPLMYISAYNEFYEAMALRQRTSSSDRKSRSIRLRLRALKRFLLPETRFLEIASGDASFAFQAASHVQHIIATDVQDVNVDYSKAPSNFSFIKVEGVSIPLPDASVDFIFSDQFLEHLHPDDAKAHLRETLRLLVAGGRYLCITPSRVTGPHDITGYFDNVATGFHLKEYDWASLVKAFKDVGFSKVKLYASGGGYLAPLPFAVATAIDAGLLALPQKLRRKLRHYKVVRALTGLFIIGVK
jgi:ubiquinone/menaquinone biosynthesis C-methylase UbiE